ncbi:MAG: efflux RND transporter permease subunit [Verrucomicrobiales bacterium]|jgi:CzcA family heavy metal efflux pump|nr:efflux RND transporter permease subunit [Verrucomicrobiae bacterium]
MLNKLIQWSLSNRGLIIGLSLLLLVLGYQSARQLPVEVLPDLTKPQVTILTEAPGLAPEEVETRVTQPLESALMGVPGLTRLRSTTDVALSLIFVEFEWGTDIYKARTLVQERLQGVREQLPEGTQPFMTPVASLMGEILLVGVRSEKKEGEPGYLPPREVRSLADWTIRRRLQSVRGIAEILCMGGGVKRIEIQPDPWKMQAWNISVEELKRAAGEAASTTTGGFIDTGSTEIMVRNLAMTVQLEDISRTVIKKVNDRPVTIAEVANVVWGVEPMRGDAALGITPEKESTPSVVMSVTKAPGFDTMMLTEEIEKALEELAPTLPDGVKTTMLFRQADFIDRAVGNLKNAIAEGAVMVTIVLFLFLLNFRTTVITLMAMPLSFAMVFLVFRWFGISVNSMTLGGLAVAIGMVVDDAIVDVENVFRRLRENASLPEPKPKLQVIASASGEVRNSIFYATVLIILVFIPLLGLTGVEGRLFGPIAIATMVSMAASFIVSLAAIPVLCSFLLNPKQGHEHKDGFIMRNLKVAVEHTFLKFGLSQPVLAIGIAVGVVAWAFSLYPKMGKDFLPAFQEETAVVSSTAAPGTSLTEMHKIAAALESELLQVEGVAKVGRRIGRAERGDHVVPLSSAEFDIDFRKDSTRSRNEILDEIRERLKNVPGTFSVVSGPLAHYVSHMLSGVSAPVVIKVFGPDLDRLKQIGTEIQSVAQTIPGLEGAKLDQQGSIPQLRIEPDRDRAAAYGFSPGHITNQMSTLLGGEEVAELREGVRTVGLVLRLPQDQRNSPETIAQIPLTNEEGQQVPLSMVAGVHEAKGPNSVYREAMQRRFVVSIKPTERDMAGMVTKLKEAVEEKVKLPEGYFLSFEGDFKAQQEATQRIIVLFSVITVVILFLLYGYFRSMTLALQVLVNLPLAIAGGLIFTQMKVNNISIATLVGFIAVGGIAARNGIMMISHYLHLMKHEGEGFTRRMIIRGTQERLAPVLMTALAAGIGLIPLVLAADEPGKEILHPVAVVIVGGLVSSVLLDFLITPAAFWLLGRKAAAHALAQNAPATH